jgi:hypothetical protein
MYFSGITKIRKTFELFSNSKDWHADTQQSRYISKAFLS